MIILFTLLTLVIIYFFYKNTIPQLDGYKKYLLIGLRSLAIIILLILLFNPILYFRKSVTQKPKLIILEDNSESMEQKIKGTEKFKYFREFVDKTFKAGKEYEILEYKFANGLTGNRNSTNLTKTIKELSQKIDFEQVHGIVLISDGWINDDDIEIIENIGIPFYTFAPEYENKNIDLEIVDVQYNKEGYVNENIPIKVILNSKNYDKEAIVELQINGEKVKNKEFNFSEKSFKEIVFKHKFDKPDLYEIELKIKSKESTEKNLGNNNYSLAMNILDEKSTALIIVDKLSWDSKFIKDAIKMLNHWQIDYLYKDKDGFKSGKRPVKLSSYLNNAKILIILNTGNLVISKEAKNLIENFVKRGGGMLFQGKPIESFAFLPVQEKSLKSNIRASLIFSEKSNRYASFDINKANIPPLPYFFVDSELQAEILAYFDNSQNSPAILFKNYRAGKIIYFSFLELWRWQMHNEGNIYYNFINNFVRWLSSQKDDRYISFTNKQNYYPGEKIRVGFQAFDEKLMPLTDLDVKINLYDNNNKKVKDTFLEREGDKYKIEFSNLDSGRYIYEIENNEEVLDKGNFIVNDNSLESRDIGFNFSFLSYITKITNGSNFNVESINNFELASVQTEKIEKTEEIPIYRKWYIILLFLIAFNLELYLRKRWGLL